MNGIRLYFHYIRIIIRSTMQYKVSFFLSAAGQLIVTFNAFLIIYFMFQRFHTVEGFTYPEVLLCFSIILAQFSIAEIFARGFDSFSGMVRKAEFDRVLVRPRSHILQVLGSKFELTRIGRFFQALVMFTYGVLNCNVVWTFPKAVTLLFMLIGGTALFSGLFLIYAALCFFTLDGLEFMNVLTDGAREFGKYPIGIYGKKMLLFCTFIIPYALIQYYPLLYLLGYESSPLYIFLPLLAVLFLLPCYALWRFGVRHYISAGS